MHTLIVGMTSRVCQELARILPDADTVSLKQTETATYTVDIEHDPKLYTLTKYDRVFYHSIDSYAQPLSFQSQVLGVMSFLQHLADCHLNPEAQIVVITDRLFSIKETVSTRQWRLHTFKAALHMGIKLLSNRYPSVSWWVQHPGLVVDEDKLISPTQLTATTSAYLLIELADRKPTFGFYTITGDHIEW